MRKDPNITRHMAIPDSDPRTYVSDATQLSSMFVHLTDAQYYEKTFAVEDTERVWNKVNKAALKGNTRAEYTYQTNTGADCEIPQMILFSIFPCGPKAIMMPKLPCSHPSALQNGPFTHD